MRSVIRLALFGLVISAAAISLVIAGDENGKPADAASTDNIAELKARIKQLEARVQELEQSQERFQELLRFTNPSPRRRALDFLNGNQSPDDQANIPGNPLTLPPAATTLNGQSVPPNWKPHEFNGSTYYIVPLSKKP